MTTLIETARKVIAFQDTRQPQHRAPEDETARPLLHRDWPTYANLRTILELYDALDNLLKAAPSDREARNVAIARAENALRQAGGPS